MFCFRHAVSALAACSTLAVAVPAQAQTPPAPASAPASAPVRNSNLDAPLFYQLLIGEIELREGDAGTGYQVLLDAARKTRDERLFQRATDIALQAKAGEQALVAARAWRQAAPASLEAHRYEVQLLIALNRSAEAVEPLRSTLALVPVTERAGAIASLPAYFARATDRKAASAALEQVLLPYAEGRLAGEAPETAGVAWAALGRSRLAAGEPALALDAGRRAQAIAPNAESVALLGIELMRSEPAGEELVKNFLAADPPAADVPRSAVRLVYARALAIGHRYAEAVPQLEAVTRDAPQFVDAWLTLGALQLELKQPARAESALTEYLARAEAAEAAAGPAVPQAIDEDAATPAQRRMQAYLLLAQAAEQRRDFQAAEGWLAKVDSSQALPVQVRRASLLAQQGRLEEGRALIRDLPERTPEEARSKLLAEAHLLRDQKQWSEANRVLANANDLYRDDTDLLYEQAMMAEKLDRMDEMEQLLRRVMALKPEQSAAYNALGYSLADRRMRLPEARELIVKAMELTPNDPFLIDSMGWVEYRMGNLEESLEWLRQAYRARPDTEIAAHLGEVLWMSGRRDEARSVWGAAHSRDAANDVLKETLARLKVDL
ncbi:MAG: tetratricopeptide repeat protein [Methylibium sp.]|nr:tetratricopeptide repeat protein [Methylibium sp.]